MTENADVDNSITLLQEQLDLMVRRNSVTNVVIQGFRLHNFLKVHTN